MMRPQNSPKQTEKIYCINLRLKHKANNEGKFRNDNIKINISR